MRFLEGTLCRYKGFWKGVIVRARVKFGIGCMLILLSLLVVPGTLAAARVEINGDRISIDVNQIPMRVVLRQLSINYGIAVKIDPDITSTLSISFNNREIEDGLKAILKPHNFVLVWKREGRPTDGSAGPHYKLEEIHIFKPGQKERMVDIQGPDRSGISDKAPGNEEETATQSETETQTRVIIKDNKVFVPVTIGYEDSEIETTLVFDTGAGSIVLHTDVAQKLGIEQGRDSQGEGVGGIKIATRMTRLAFVQVGPFKKENLRADIIDYEGAPDAEYNGLLGMNFIRGLKYTIDFDNQVIQWQR